MNATVLLTVEDGSATSPDDYIRRIKPKKLLVKKGGFSNTFKVTIKDDKLIEGDETIKVKLSNAFGAEIGDSKAIGTIINNDSPRV